jgi:Zn-dependent metalloprotease
MTYNKQNRFMKNLIVRTVCLMMCLSLSSIAIGQGKQITLPKVTNPFQGKKLSQKPVVIVPTMAKTDTIKKSQLQIENVNGSFYVDLSKEKKTSEDLNKSFNSWFKLDQNHTFQLLSSKTDEMQITHNYYQQYYKGFVVEGSILMLHSKNGHVYASNGQVSQFNDLNNEIRISSENGIDIAKKHLKVTELINNYPVETLICKILSDKLTLYKLAHRVRIDSNNPFVMANIYIDVENGEVLNVVSLIANCIGEHADLENSTNKSYKLDSKHFESNNLVLADTPATANTMYSGTQSIITDSFNGGYRLRDNGRKIETHNATNATALITSGFTGSSDFTNSTTTWNGVPRLKSFTISTISQNWWYTSLVDQLPDLYIKVKNSLGQIVYTSNYINNTNPIVTFDNLDILITSSPYTIELWDYDTVGGDDFGGSYIVSNTVGTQIWSVNGNNGSYVINSLGNPAIDVHWGMEKTYDFYLNVFNRNSFDGNGSLIKNYLNPSPNVVQQVFTDTGLPNNAFAAPYPYNFMVFGMGDGITMSPLVGLDVEGHEYTHMVVNYRQNLYTDFNDERNSLIYQGESGALNESFSDIFGTCIEFYAQPPSTANWNIGEDFMLPAGNVMRSMSNPNLKQHPDTYNIGPYWKDPTNINFDYGGVHFNSGVQNYWFYLLAQNTSTPTITGTNDLNDAYSVTSIGINKARQIAYKNLTTYLPSPNSTYMDSYYGSLLATQDLYGNPSPEYTSVRNAWYAVGLGNDPNNFCSGTTSLSASNGSFSDGSGSASYGDNATCKWVIAPAGATQISINFTAFDTEATYDIVTVYDGPTEAYPVLATWWGNTLPPTITSTGGAICIKFTSDNDTNFSGWSANYSSVITNPTCSGGTLLSTPSGSFNDGSISGNYTNNQQCYWYIAPPCATSVTLSFSQLDTEFNYDAVIIYDSLETTTPLAVFSGNTLPSSITSNTGIMLVVFVSDFANTYSGFTANYTSTGSSYCSGVTILNTSDYGTISDGSGSNNYCNNSNCSWLIQPPQATSVTLNFTAFELEPASTDGNSIYDAVEVYDGASASATLLGRYTGNNIPTTITSSGGSMYIRFYSDYAYAYQGWSAYYTSTQNPYCNGTATTLTASSGSFSDGSGSNIYANNSNCSWLIQPANATSITLSFNSFDTELNYDGLIVYDGTNSSAPVLGQFSGSTLPASVTSTGGNMYVSFLSDEALRANGWNASYTSTNSSGGGTTTYLLDRKVLSSAGKTQTAGSTIITWTLGEPIVGNMNAGSVKLTNGFHPLLTSQALEIQDHSIDFSIFIAPNPVTDYLNIYHKENHELNVKLFDITGKKLLEKYINASENKLDASALPQGTYLIYVQDKLTNKTNTYKIIKN